MASIGRQVDWRLLSNFAADEDKPTLASLAECTVIDNHRPLTAVPTCGLSGPLMYQRLTLTSHDPAPGTAQVTQTVLRRFSRRKTESASTPSKGLEGVICVMAVAVSDELAAVALLVLSSLNSKYETPKFPVFVDPQSPMPPFMTISALSYAIAAHAETLSREIMSLIYASGPFASRRNSLNRRASRMVSSLDVPPLLAAPTRRSTRPTPSPTRQPPPASSAARPVPSPTRPATRPSPSPTTSPRVAAQSSPSPTFSAASSSSCGLFAGLKRRFIRNNSKSSSATPTIRAAAASPVPTTIPPPAEKPAVAPPLRARMESVCLSQCDSADSLGELADFSPRMRRTRAFTEDSIALSVAPGRQYKPRERRRMSGIEETDMEREDRYYSLCVETIISIASGIAFARQCGALAVVLGLDPSSGLYKTSRLDALERALSLWLLNSQGPELGIPCIFAGKPAAEPGITRALITPTKLRRGDHIYRQIRLKGGLSYLTHHGIYVGRGEVIHFSVANEESISALLVPSQENASLRKTTILDFMKYGGQLYVERYERTDQLSPANDSLRYERGWPGRSGGVQMFAKSDHDEDAARRAEFAYVYFHTTRVAEEGGSVDPRLREVMQSLARDFEFPSYNLFNNNCEHFCRWCKTGSAGSMQADVFGAAVDAFVRGFARQKSSQFMA